MTYTVGSLFSGIGGLDLAAHWAGFTTSWFVEREPFCQKVLAKHWPGMPCHSDVFECHNLPHVDVIVGGFPCQPFSVAGNRKGADDERYLLPEMLRIIREVKPYAVLFENVPGFPSLNDGAEFKYLLRALAEMGFDAEWGHLRASDSGAPHQRERWFCVAYSTSKGLSQWGQTKLTTGNEETPTRMDSELKRCCSVANAVCDGNGNAGDGRALHHTERDSAAQECRRIIEQHGAIAPGERVGNAHALGIQGQRPTRKQIMAARHGQGQPKSASHRAGQSRSTQPRLCGTSDGLPDWLDFVGWPARPGEDQHAYEPSRVTSTKSPDRAARLKACGNAVVPQVAYPLFAAIHDWLTQTASEQVA